MASELQHIDDFFRKMNDTSYADVSSADLHWQQIQLSLPVPLSLPAKKPRTRILKPWMKYAAVITIAASSIYIGITKPWKGHSQKIEFAGVRRDAGNTSNNDNSVGNKKTSTPVQPKLTAAKTSVIKKAPIITENKSVIPIYDVLDSSISKEKAALNTARAFSNFYNELKKPAEEFIIDAAKDTVIYCKEGSSLFIPASCFQSLTGAIITGAVTISVQEFYSFSDIVANKLTTLSEGRQLITGGMLNISATAAAQEIMIRPGVFINLKMPTRVFDPAMQLFTAAGETAAPTQTTANTDKVNNSNRVNGFAYTGGINWMPAGQQQLFIKENRKNIRLINLLDNPVEVVYHGYKSVAKFRIPFNCRLTTNEMKKLLEEKYGNRYDKIKVKREWMPVSFTKRAIRKEFVDDWYDTHFVGDSIEIPLRFARRMKLVTLEDSLAWEAKWKKECEDAVKRNEAWSEFAQKRDDYNFNIGSLGWINCDRFSNYPPSRLHDFRVEVGDEFQSAWFTAILILDKENSAVSGHWEDGGLSFLRLPYGETVNIVCVGAKQGKVFKSVQKFKVTRGEKYHLQFKETNPEDFKRELAQFGNVTSAR